MTRDFDAIVIGVGHAGIEAALALVKTGASTVALSVSLDNVGYLACNPSIGGTGKGHLVRELDALGGFMGIAADNCATQVRMLNSSKGPAVRSLRAQVDKYRYHEFTKAALENQNALTLRQDEAKAILHNHLDGTFTVEGALGINYRAKAVVVATGVYLDSKIYTGSIAQEKGPACFTRSHGLASSLDNLGYTMRRFKTGTPARIDKRTVDFTALEVQEGEVVPYTFSAMSKKPIKNTSVCYLGYTNEATHEIIRKNLHRAPKYAGEIFGVGARYCPSIEDKVVRFSDKARHALFLEPEGDSTCELYVQGISTSLPADVQLQLYRSIKGLENVELMRDAYAIEYECIDARNLYPTLMSKKHNGLFFCGQVNGTSGYEEAAAQGIVAGINASLYLRNKAQIVFDRTKSYIGVMTDDLATVGTDEPYRMLTGRAECRLALRQDNADLRLTEIGRSAGLVDDKRYNAYKKKVREIQRVKKAFDNALPVSVVREVFEKAGEVASAAAPMTIGELLRHPQVTPELLASFDKTLTQFSPIAVLDAYTSVRYDAYLRRQDASLVELARLENAPLNPDIDYSKISGLRKEAQEKLNSVNPLSIGQAGRISGVTPADIWVLITKCRDIKL